MRTLTRGICLILCFVLASCAAASSAAPTLTALPTETSAPTATTPPTAAPTAEVSPTDQVTAQASLPLSEPGPYIVGTREMTFTDEKRDGRVLVTTVWYPAVEAASDAAPDFSSAPYPLILYSHGGEGSSRTDQAALMSHLASYGFVVAAMTHAGDTDWPPISIVDRPLDILFVLDQLASLSTGDLVGMIDADHTGVAGYSRGGLTAMMLTGAQIDTDYQAEWCAEYPNAFPVVCNVVTTANDDITAYRARFDPPLIDGEPWPPFTDGRIRAVLSLAGAWGAAFGEEGLASASVPTLIITGTKDITSPYDWGQVFAYQHLGSSQRYLLSVIGVGHRFGYSPRLAHFATAFFGYTLQGQEGDAQYLTEDYVNGIEGWRWGVYDAAASLPPRNTRDVAFFGQDTPDALLDVYLPAEGNGPYPTIVYVTPPARPAKIDMSAYAGHLTQQGYAAVAIQIRPSLVSLDAFCGLAWVHSNAGAYGFDPGHIVAFGISGSGSAVALMGAVDSNEDVELLRNCPYAQPEGRWVQGVVTYEALFGTPISLAQDLIRTDSARFWEMPQGDINALYDLMIKTPPANWPEIPGLTTQQQDLLERYPLQWIDSSDSPFLLIYGSESELPWMEDEQHWFADYLEKAGVRVELVRKEGLAHSTVALAGHTEEMDVFLAELFEGD